MSVTTIVAAEVLGFMKKKGVAKLFGLLEQQVRDARDEKAAQALHDTVQQIAIVDQTTEEGAVERVAAILRQADAETAETLVEHFRYHMDALDPAAHLYVARLTAWYLHERRARDAFFRRVGRMLVDATGVEIEQLHLMFALAREAAGPSGLSGDAWLRLDSHAAPTGTQKTYAGVADGRGVVLRQSHVEAVTVLDGMAALKRALLLSRPDPNEWRVDFLPSEHELLGRLVRVFA